MKYRKHIPLDPPLGPRGFTPNRALSHSVQQLVRCLSEVLESLVCEISLPSLPTGKTSGSVVAELLPCSPGGSTATPRQNAAGFVGSADIF